MTSATTDRRLGLSPGVAIKTPCRVTTTAAITLSGEQTIDGVAAVTDDRVLVRNQSDQTTNGIYVCDTGTWERDKDFDGNNDIVKGTIVRVTNGTLYSDSYWAVTTANPITIDSSSLTFSQTVNSLSGVSAFMQTVLDDTTAALARTTLGAVGLTGTDTIAGDKTFTGAIITATRAAFSAYLTADTANNVTGDASAYALNNSAFTEIYDLGSNFNASTGIFTAAVSGVYVFGCSIQVANLGSGHAAGAFSLNTSNKLFDYSRLNVGAARDTSNIVGQGAGVVAFLDAGDTAYLQTTVSDGTKTVGVLGQNNAMRTSISGALVCQTA